MESEPHVTSAAYNPERAAQIWRRVSPQLDPYPASSAQTADTADYESDSLTLPGASEDPCCMGTQALSSLEVLQGFWREEIIDARTYLAFSRRAPNPEARRLLHALAADETEHARQLQSAHYLITGKPYRAEVCAPPFAVNGYCAALRARYHEEVCGGFNYARAAAEISDFCLEKIFNQLSADEYRHAELLRKLLGKALLC